MPRTPAQFVRTASPEALYVLSGIAQYSGAVIAIQLFDEGLSPSTVAVTPWGSATGFFATRDIV